MPKIEIVCATATQVGALTALIHASSAYRGDYASILDGCVITRGYVEANPTFTATGDGEILKSPKIRWDRPELRFDVPTG